MPDTNLMTETETAAAMVAAYENIRVGRMATIPVVPSEQLPMGCSPHGTITREAYLVTSLNEVEGLARAIRKLNKKGGLTGVAGRKTARFIQNIPVRLMASGRIQIGSPQVWSPREKDIS